MKKAVGLALLGLVLSGCSSAFYLTSYDVASYTQQLGTEEAANDALATWRGAVVQIDFAMVDGMPRISSSNLREVFRQRGAIRFAPEMMDRAADEVQRELGPWIGPELRRLAERLGARLTSLRRLRLEVLDPPVFRFDLGAGEIAFMLRVRATAGGSLKVPDVDQPLSVSLDVNDYRLSGTLRLGAPHPQGTMVRLVATPGPGSINISGIPDRQFTRRVVDLLGPPLSAPVDVTRLLSYDRFAVPELRLRREPSTGGIVRTRLRASYLVRPDAPEPVLHAVVRSPSGQLHHGRRVDGAWTGFAAIAADALAAADPALVGSGADRLDAVAVDASGRLRHVRHREGAWSEVSIPDPGSAMRLDARRPALLATAPGQLEVVAVATDGRLQHVRRVDGSWQSLRPVPMRGAAPVPPLRDPALAQSGSKLLLLFVDQGARLFGIAFDLETGYWGAMQQLASQGVRGALATAACGDGRVDVAYVSRAHGSIVHQTVSATLDPFRLDEGAAGLSASTWSLVSGVTPADDPTLACSGHQRVEMLVAGGDQQLFHNHFSPAAGEVDGRRYSMGWQGWQPVGLPLVRSGVSPFVRVGTPVAAAVSSMGRVHVLGAGWPGRHAAADPRSMFDNSFSAQQWGRAPWATVQWRGWDAIVGPAIVGRPALALSDRHADLLVVGSDTGLRRALVGSRVPAAFTGGPAVGRARHQSEPTALISGPGTLDVLYLGEDQRLHHVRYLDGVRPLDVRVDERPGIVSNARPAAVALGGQLEVVALGLDRTLRHWRYRLGRWEAGPTIPDATSVQAPPALLSAGAGRLELLAVTEGKVSRWRFRGGQWEAGQQVGGDFLVSPIAFSALAVSSWGDGTMDLVVAEEGTGRVFHRHLVSEDVTVARPRSSGNVPPFTEIVGLAAGKLALAALGPTRLLVLGEARHGGLFTARSGAASRDVLRELAGRTPVAPLTWRTEALVGPSVEITGLVAIGTHEVLASGIDARGQLYLDRFLDWRWDGYAPLHGQTLQTRSSPPIPPSLAAPW